MYTSLTDSPKLRMHGDIWISNHRPIITKLSSKLLPGRSSSNIGGVFFSPKWTFLGLGVFVWWVCLNTLELQETINFLTDTQGLPSRSRSQQLPVGRAGVRVDAEDGAQRKEAAAAAAFSPHRWGSVGWVAESWSFQQGGHELWGILHKCMIMYIYIYI